MTEGGMQIHVIFAMRSNSPVINWPMEIELMILDIKEMMQNLV